MIKAVVLVQVHQAQQKLTTGEGLEVGEHKLYINRGATLSNCTPERWSYRVGIYSKVEGDSIIKS